ncbi:hypothetical protein ACHEXK_09080 [Limnohabitans sp. DCL3]|uniref:hypothetical protein n=1 Tax=Limnohabitans sp. DCL3 TaxID=3374103 RepID=UPI003A875D7F
MSPEASQEYQRAVEEAANAFMKVMALRGFNVRDYPQNFVAQMAKQTKLAFEPNRLGAHQQADQCVSDMLRAAPLAAQVVNAARVKAMPFPALRRRMA